MRQPVTSELARGPERSAEPETVAITPAKDAARVLVVDDNEDSAAVLAMLLETCGFRAITANDGVSALRAAAHFDPHVAIDLISAARFGRLRDPLVKGEEVPGVMRTDYWVGSVGNGSMPPDLTARLDPYRNLRV